VNPFFKILPLAWVLSIHCSGVSVKLLSPPCFLNPSNPKGSDEPFSSSRSQDLSDFDGIKIRVVELLPDAEKPDGVPVPDPVPDKVVHVLGVLVAGGCRG
jgi:hypothetical protein